jgi:hypothetical protein
MTVPLPPLRAEGWTATAANGCTARGCGTQVTASLDGHLGRRCANHPPRFDPRRAFDIALRDPHAALAYIRTTFPGENA